MHYINHCFHVGLGWSLRVRYNQLSQELKLTKYEYEFLKGNEEYWPSWGAALGVVSEWCRNMGFGDFGKPTERGKEAMKVYENDQDHE